MTRMIAGVAALAALGLGPDGQAPMNQQYRPLGYQVVFQITQSATSVTSGTENQLTIIFANRSAEDARPPRPLFGEDIVQEFSFSGMDFVKNQLRFTRRLSDKSFLDARYIRVVNHGNDGWDGDQISMVIDGQDVFRNVRMAPHIGGDPSKGFQNFNPRGWSGRSYWEAELVRLRRYSAK